MVSELDLIESSTGERPPYCPWWAFHEPDVVEVLRCYDYWESGQLREAWGDDPPYWLWRATHHYHRQLTIVRSESWKLYREESKKDKRARVPQGFTTEFEIKG